MSRTRVLLNRLKSSINNWDPLLFSNTTRGRYLFATMCLALYNSFYSSSDRPPEGFIGFLLSLKIVESASLYFWPSVTKSLIVPSDCLARAGKIKDLLAELEVIAPNRANRRGAHEDFNRAKTANSLTLELLPILLHRTAL